MRTDRAHSRSACLPTLNLTGQPYTRGSAATRAIEGGPGPPLPGGASERTADGYRSTGSPAARHSGKPFSSLRALRPRSRSVRTASKDMRQ